MRSVFYPRLLNGSFGDPAFYVRLAHRAEALLFDCGSLGRLVTRDLLKIRTVFISHCHIDHMVGFDTLLRAFLYQDRTLLVYGPTGLARQIAGRLSGYTWNLIEGYPLVLTVREWEAGPGCEVSFRAENAFRPEQERDWQSDGDLMLKRGDLEVKGMPLEHGGITSLAFSLQEPLHVAIHKEALERHGYTPGAWLTRFKDLLRNNAPSQTPLDVPLMAGGTTRLPLGLLSERIAHTERGMKIVYVTDVSPTIANQEKIAVFAKDAHLLAIEAVFAQEELPRARERNHLTARIAGMLAGRAGVARLLTFHHSPRYLDRPELLAKEADQAFLESSRSAISHGLSDSLSGGVTNDS